MAYFLVSAIFIGWPSVKSIEFAGAVATMNRETDKLLQNPTDSTTRQAVEKNLKKVEGRPASDARTAAVIARAQFAIGNETEAAASLKQALKADPKLPEAVALQQKTAGQTGAGTSGDRKSTGGGTNGRQSVEDQSGGRVGVEEENRHGPPITSQ